MVGTARCLAVIRHNVKAGAGTVADMASHGERQVRSERVGKYLLYQTIGKGTFGKWVTVRTWWDVPAGSHRE